MNMHVVKIACISCCLCLCLSITGLAEELRMMTYQGNPPEEHVRKFEQMVQDKYGIDLTITMSYIRDPSEYYKALKNKTTDLINAPHNMPKDPRYKLIQGKLILPIDLNNIPNYTDLIPDFQKGNYLTENNEVYGVPFIYAPYGLAYNTTVMPEAPTSWEIFWDPQYAGKYAIGSELEQNIGITALASGVTREQLGQYDAISSPEFQEKLTSLVHNAKTMWMGVDTADDLQGLSFATAWGFSFAELEKRGEIWQFADPREGMIGGLGCAMLSNTLQDTPQLKQIAEELIDYLISPEYQIDVVVRTLSSGPVNATIKERLTPEEVTRFHLDNLNYFHEQLIPYPILDSRSRKGYELLWKKATR